MSTLRNKVQLIGNIGSDPKITVLESGSKTVRFSIATNEYYRNAKGEKVQSTQWHNVVAWDKRADVIEQYAHKGKEIAIEGRLISRSYTNELDVKCYVTEIVATEILLLGSKESNGESQNGEQASTNGKGQKTEAKTKNGKADKAA